MESAFGVEHGDIAKAFNPLKAAKGMKAGKQAAKAERSAALKRVGSDSPFDSPDPTAGSAARRTKRGYYNLAGKGLS